MISTPTDQFIEWFDIGKVGFSWFHTRMDAKSPDAQAPSIAAPSNTASFTSGNRIGKPEMCKCDSISLIPSLQMEN